MRTAAVLLLTLALTTPSSGGRGVLSTVPADRPAGAPPRRLEVRVRALVSTAGVVDSAVALAPERGLREAAEASVRWWIFQPGPARAWTTVTVSVPPADRDEEPMRPDRVALAREAEARGDERGAIDAWTGALTRVGRHSSLRNEWAVREHLLRLARRMSAPPPPPHFIAVHVREWHGQQERTVTTADHAGLVESFAEALNGAPWWPDPYLWCTASQLGSGQRAGALRNLRAFRIGARDSAGRALADRALAGIAAGDTIGVEEMLKKAGQEHRPENADE